MGYRPPEECNKGDICSFEICVERSSTNEYGETITLWKKEDDKFQVSKGLKKLRRFKWYKPESEAWREYKNWCKKYGCSPYP